MRKRPSDKGSSASSSAPSLTPSPSSAPAASSPRAGSVAKTPPRPESALLFLGLLALLTLLRQEAFYKVDGQNLVGMLARGEGGHPLHPLFLPLARALTALPRGLGMSAFGALELVSALGVAFGVSCAHRVALRAFGGERLRAFTAAILVAAAPSLLFFGTVVEFHGLFFGCAGLFFWAWTNARAKVRANAKAKATAASPARLLLVPLLSALSAGVHASGHLLPLFVLLGLPRMGPKLSGRQKLLLVLLHLLFYAALVFPFLQEGPKGPAATWDYLLTSAERVWALLPRLPASWAFVQEEWFRPLFPLSLLVFASFLGRAWREAFAFLLALLAYLLFSFFALGNQAERGAYLLPLLLPAAILTLRAWPRVLLPLALALSLGGFYLGIRDIHRHDKPRRIPGFTQGYLRLTGGKARLLVGDLAETESILRSRPDLPYVPFYELLAGLELAERSQNPARIRALDQALFTFLDQALERGTPILFTPSCFEVLPTQPRIQSWKALAQKLKARYRWSPLQAGGFRAYLLRPAR